MEAQERVPALLRLKPVFLCRFEKPAFSGHCSQGGKRVPVLPAESAACADFGAGSKGLFRGCRWSLELRDP